MPSYYAAAHVVAVPSLLEGFNKVAVEAAALGTPVVISTGAGAHSYFSQHRAGLVVPAGDVAALADAIAHILSEPSDAEEMAQRGYAMARLFTAQQVAGQLLELFSLIHQ
jgi:glycosyltransferase involved in cell wall biosynthesis